MIDTKLSGISYRIKGGLDSEKPSNPRKSQCWLSLDTRILYICFEDNVWTKYGRITSSEYSGVKTMMIVSTHPVNILGG